MISTYYIKYYTKVVECSFDETFSFFSTYNTEPVIDTLYTRKVEGDDEDLLFVAAHVATKQSGERREERGDYNRPHRTEANFKTRGLSTGSAIFERVGGAAAATACRRSTSTNEQQARHCLRSHIIKLQ